MSRIYLTVLIFFLSIPSITFADTREIIAEYGKDFKESLNNRADLWISGGDKMPSFINHIDSQVDAMANGTKTPVEIDFQKFYQKNHGVFNNIPMMEQIMGKDYEARGKFLNDMSTIVVSGQITNEYNYYINESRRIGCWKFDTPYKQECSKLLNLGLGIFLTLYLNQNVLGTASFPVDRTLKALGTFLMGEQLDAKTSVGISTMMFSVEPDPNFLWNIGYQANTASKVFNDFSTGELNAIDENRLTTPNDGAYRNLFINQFRNSIDTLQTVLNDKKRGWDLANKTAQRIEALKLPLRTIAKELPEHGFSIKELYSGLGVLNQYYTYQAEFISLAKLKVFRGDLRSSFPELTDSLCERLLLKTWGFLSSYGTSITGLTIALIGIFSTLFLLCFFSARSINTSNKLLHGLRSYLRILTIRSENEDLWGKRWLALGIEACLFIYMPIYFGFLITFLMNAN